jgi:hypothetical protein
LSRDTRSHDLKLVNANIPTIFYIKRLCKDPRNPLPGQTNLEPLLLKVEEGKIKYKVQEVLVVKCLHSKLKYKVKWKG